MNMNVFFYYYFYFVKGCSLSMMAEVQNIYLFNQIKRTVRIRRAFWWHEGRRLFYLAIFHLIFWGCITHLLKSQNRGTQK